MARELTPFEQLQEAIFLAILQASDPRNQVISSEGTRGAEIAYDAIDVLSALNWVAATFVVQSGEYPTKLDRKRFAKKWSEQLLDMCEPVEEQFRNRGAMEPFKPS